MLGKVLISLDIAEFEDGGHRIAAQLAHLLGKTVRLHEVSGLGRAIGHECATPVLANDQAQALELLKGESDCRAGQTIALGELTLGGDHVASVILMLDFVGKNIHELVIQRLFASRCHHENRLRYKRGIVNSNAMRSTRRLQSMGMIRKKPGVRAKPTPGLQAHLGEMSPHQSAGITRDQSTR